MPARLTVYPPDQPVQRYVLDPRREYLVGRGPDCDLRIQDSRLSRRHARIFCHVDRWLLSNLGSKNGVRLNGHEVDETALDDGNWISFGGLLGHFDVLSEERLEMERDRAQARWQTTVDLSRRFDPGASVDTLLGQLLDAVLSLADAERGFVMLSDDQGQLSVRARKHRSGLPIAGGFAGSTGALQRVLAEKRPVVLCDARADALLGSRPSVESHQIRALICLPLAVGEQLTGLIYLDSAQPGKAFTDLDVELLDAFASHAALVLGVASVQTGLTDLAQLLPAQMTRGPAADGLVRRLVHALPRRAVLAADGMPA